MPEKLQTRKLEFAFYTYSFVPNMLCVEVWVKNKNVATMVVPAKDWMNPKTNKGMMKEFAEWYLENKYKGGPLNGQ